MLAAKAFGERSYPCYVSCFVIEVPPSFFLAPETSVGASLSLHCVKRFSTFPWHILVYEGVPLRAYSMGWLEI
ncbi:hypothetical protein V6N11_043215 [Hibiscus sabdariffa]|uniref:Uncharacterized protein n=1 Tax=Hibiscus sabdariffa TaxID=183260 RepID=A0ABR2QZ31_9ROSI